MSAASSVLQRMTICSIFITTSASTMRPALCLRSLLVVSHMLLIYQDLALSSTRRALRPWSQYTRRAVRSWLETARQLLLAESTSSLARMYVEQSASYYVYLRPVEQMFNGLERAHFLSPGGQCKPWDASADGYSRAEGSSLLKSSVCLVTLIHVQSRLRRFCLKRLSQAIADSDNILGVIRGVEINQSSAAASITRPHGRLKKSFFALCFRKRMLSLRTYPSSKRMAPERRRATRRKFKAFVQRLRPSSVHKRPSSKPLNVTSIKGNIGHAEAASGAASLAKVLLMFRHPSDPPQVGLETLNPKILDLAVDGTSIHTGPECLSWEGDRSRIALINNFGAAGSNAALLVEEPPVLPVLTADGSTDNVIVGLSADTKEAALRLRDSYVAQLAGGSQSVLDFAYTATSRRTLRPWRICVSGSSRDALVKQLTVSKPIQASAEQKKIVFVFSGQGAQYPGMGQQLYVISSTFKAVVDECHTKLVAWGYPGVLSIISPSSANDVKLDVGSKVVAFQCAIYVLECALTEVWASWGIRPDAIVGHRCVLRDSIHVLILTFVIH